MDSVARESSLPEEELGDAKPLGIVILQRVAVSGFVGGLTGIVHSSIRGGPLAFTSLSMASNFAIIGGVCSTFYEGIVMANPSLRNTQIAYAVSGGISGALLTYPFAGPRKVVPGIMLFTLGGLGFHYAGESLERWKLKKATKIREERRRKKEAAAAAEDGKG